MKVHIKNTGITNMGRLTGFIDVVKGLYNFKYHNSNLDECIFVFECTRGNLCKFVFDNGNSHIVYVEEEPS